MKFYPIGLVLVIIAAFSACNFSESEDVDGRQMSDQIQTSVYNLDDIKYSSESGEKFENSREGIENSVYSFFGDIFFVDEDSGMKSELVNAYELLGSGSGVSYEEFYSMFHKVLGGNVLGIEFLAENKLEVLVVFFMNDNSAVQNSYSLVFGMEDDFKFYKLEEIESRELIFDDEELVYEVLSANERFSVRLVKNLLEVNFLSSEGYEVPAFLGRYDLVVRDFERREEFLVDYSFDPFSTNLPFEVIGFEKENRFLVFFEQDFARSFNLFDLQSKELANIEVPGIWDRHFWTDDELIICTKASGDLPAVIAVYEFGKWELNELKVLYPDNLSSKSRNLINALQEIEVTNQELDCNVRGSFLNYKNAQGESEIINLTRLD